MKKEVRGDDELVIVVFAVIQMQPPHHWET